MIDLNSEKTEFPIELDLGRPNLFNEDDFLYWDKIFSVIETDEIPIKISASYYDIKKYCDDRQKYGGGGMKFCFWFKNQLDCDTIFTKLKEIKYRSVA